MAEIAGVTVNWRASPRIITIPDTLTEVTIADLQDTLLSLEDGDEGMVHPHLRNTSGGEELGGGVNVGWTMELQNAQLAFQARTAGLESGSATTGDAAGQTLIDSTALFVTNGVGRGDIIYNFTDDSKATVLSVDSETQITHTALTGGTGNDWDIADTYEVYDVVQCNVAGGNLVAVDDVGSSISAIFPTFGTQVLLTASSSATNQELAAIQYASFNNAVHIDVISGSAGTDYPLGTPESPVNNLADAKTIATNNGFVVIQIHGDLTLGATDIIDNFTLIGSAINKTLITLTAGVSCEDTEFDDASITGTITGEAIFNNCQIETLAGVGDTDNETIFRSCLLVTSVTLLAGGTQKVLFIDCQSGVPGATTPLIDANGSTAGIALRNYSGGIQIDNVTQGQACSFDFVSGQIIFDSTVSNIDAQVRGSVKVTDNSTGGTVDQTAVVQPQSAFTDGFVFIDTVNGEAGSVFPIGTSARPSNNIADATTIANAFNLRKFRIRGSVTLAQAYTNWSFIGNSEQTDTLALGGQSVDGSDFSLLNMSGVASGTIRARDCVANTVSGVDGVFESCAFLGTYTVPALAQTFLYRCVGAGFSAPIIDMGSVGGKIVAASNLTNYWAVDNMAGAVPFPSIVNLEFDSGTLTLNATNTLGTINVRGSVFLTDNSAGAAVNLNALTQALTWNELVADYNISNSFGEIFARIQGITGENVKWSSITFDANNNMTSATITQYTDNTLTVSVRSWIVNATYNVDSELLTYELKEV